MTSLLEIEGLRKYFPVGGGPLGIRTVAEIRAVDGVSLVIREGETLALVGESGCGKTTTAKLVLRLEEPSSGKILLRGKDVNRITGKDLKQFHLDVQAVFQDPWSSLSPRMRVFDIVSEALLVNGICSKRDARRRVEDILIQVGLQRWHADLYPHEFSGGQRQRIALAAAMITEPKLVVLDEPVSALDVSVQAQVMNLLKAIQRDRSTTFLLVAHDLATVRYMADRVAVMYLGEILEEANVDELFNAPSHPYTQALLASALPPHPLQQSGEQLPTGEVPSPLNPPSGCRFRTRCPHAMERCSTESPKAHLLNEEHWVSCHLFEPGSPG